MDWRANRSFRETVHPELQSGIADTRHSHHVIGKQLYHAINGTDGLALILIAHSQIAVQHLQSTQLITGLGCP